MDASPYESVWDSPNIVSNFTRKKPSTTLLGYVREFSAGRRLRVLDIGCGAGRHLRPLLEAGHDCRGTDTSEKMLEAAARLLSDVTPDTADILVRAPMHELPFDDRSFDLIVSHGVWNLARTEQELRLAIREASRVADSGAALYLTTFSRNTLPPTAEPVPGSTYIFTDFNDEPQCFLTRDQLQSELEAVSFRSDSEHQIRELNRPAYWESSTQTGLSIVHGKRPVLFEGAWIRTGAEGGTRHE